MGAAKDKFDKRSLGRAPDCGRVSFRTGATLHGKDRLRNRNTKVARQALRKQLKGE